MLIVLPKTGGKKVTAPFVSCQMDISVPSVKGCADLLSAQHAPDLASPKIPQ
jgi:hypothetical protein